MNTPTIPRRRGRPPKELAGYSETRESLLRAGVAVLTEKGFSSTGIEEILRNADVPKGSFYHFFASKEAFGLELIDRYAERTGADVSGVNWYATLAMYKLAALYEYSRRRFESGVGDPYYADPGLVSSFLAAGERLAS